MHGTDLYNDLLQPDSSLLKKDPGPEAVDESPPILKAEVQAEVEEAVRNLKSRSPGTDNVPSELIKEVEDVTTAAFTALCKKIQGELTQPRKGPSH